MDLELPPEARALLDAVVAIGSDLDLRGVLSRIVEASCRLTDAEYGVLGIVDEEGEFVDLVPNGLAAEQFQQFRQAGQEGEVVHVPTGHGLVGLVPRERRTVRADRVADHPEAGEVPASHPVIDRFLGAPVLVGDQAFGHLYLGNKRGGLEFTRTDQALVEALARAAGVMIDHARTYEQTEWRRRWLDVMASVSTSGSETLSGTQRVQQLLDDLMEALRDLCAAELATLVLLRSGGLLEVRQVAGDPTAAAEVVDRHAETVREAIERHQPVQLPVGPGRITLVVPVQSRLGGSGAILVHEATEPPSLRGAMLGMVEVTADRMGLILDRNQALRDRARLLVAKDRDRIARDLHDLVIQRLFATGMQLQAAQGLDPDELRGRVADAVGELDVVIKELRSTIFELGAGSGRPLLEQVRELVAEYAPLLGFQPVLRVAGPVDRALVPEAGTHVLTTLREALSNITRHASASSVSIELTASPAWFRLRVSDDGVGFDPATVRAGGGSTNLRSRAEDLGGHLSVASAPGGGTTLEWVIPAVG